MPPQQMDDTPQAPPGVQAQMGAGPEKVPFSGVGQMMAKNKPPGASGGADPGGALKSAVDTITRVIDNLATTSKVGAPFAARIKEMLQAWIAEDAKSGPGGGGPQPISAKPPEGGGGAAGFVG